MRLPLSADLRLRCGEEGRGRRGIFHRSPPLRPAEVLLPSLPTSSCNEFHRLKALGFFYYFFSVSALFARRRLSAGRDPRSLSTVAAVLYCSIIIIFSVPLLSYRVQNAHYLVLRTWMMFLCGYNSSIPTIVDTEVLLQVIAHLPQPASNCSFSSSQRLPIPRCVGGTPTTHMHAEESRQLNDRTRRAIATCFFNTISPF